MQSMASQRVGHNWVTEQQQQINYTSIEKKKESDSRSDVQLERRNISLRAGSQEGPEFILCE